MIKLAYILAASHSGSTLLSMLLGAHPQTCTVGELKLTPGAIGDVDRYRCSCGELIRSCGFWNRVQEAMAGRNLQFDIANAGTNYRLPGDGYAHKLSAALHRGRFQETLRDAALWMYPSWRKHLKRTHKQNSALISTVADLSGAKIVIDSSKLALRLKYLLKNPDLDIKVIRLIRDGRAVALTYTDPSQFADAQDSSLRGGGSGGDRKGERLSKTLAARAWRRSNIEAEHLLARLDEDQWTEVRYEEYCAEPDKTLARLFEFLEVDPTLAVRDFRSIAHHVLGNGMRLDATSEIRLDDRWRTELTDEDMWAFDREAGQLNKQYSYM